MSWNKKLLLFTIFSFILVSGALSQDLPEPIVKAFSQGNAHAIAVYFKNNVELNINGTENVYSTTQAEIILKDFFKSNPPISFEVIHQGGQGGARYAISKLTSSKNSFRVTLLIKSIDNKPFIHQLRIERDGN